MTLAQRIKQSFDKHFDAPIEVWDIFATHCSLLKVKKNEVLKAAGKTEKAGYFIFRGC